MCLWSSACNCRKVLVFCRLVLQTSNSHHRLFLFPYIHLPFPVSFCFLHCTMQWFEPSVYAVSFPQFASFSCIPISPVIWSFPSLPDRSYTVNAITRKSCCETLPLAQLSLLMPHYLYLLCLIQFHIFRPVNLDYKEHSMLVLLLPLNVIL